MSLFSLSNVATVLMLYYLYSSISKFYSLMNPLASIDISELPSDRIINPFWTKREQYYQIKAYLSTSEKFNLDFVEVDDDVENNFEDRKDVILLWDSIIHVDKPGLSGKDVEGIEIKKKVFISCENDRRSTVLNKSVAMKWFDDSDESMFDKSLLITGFKSILAPFFSAGKEESDNDLEVEPHVVELDENSPIWSNLMRNRTVMLHSLLIRHMNKPDLKPMTVEERKRQLSRLMNSNSLLFLKEGVALVKYDDAVPVKPTRSLYKDLTFLLNKYIFSRNKNVFPPWDLEKTQSEKYTEYQEALRQKSEHVLRPYWKPEVSIRLVTDTDSYPFDYMDNSYPIIHFKSMNKKHPSGYAYLPPMHIDEIGLTSEKYILLNETVSALPLRLTFDAHSLTPQRWRLLSHISMSLETNKEMGFDNEDIDDIRRLIADTSVTLLTVTLIASILHLLFEFLTFKNDVQFWNQNKDAMGLSIRSLFVDFFFSMCYIVVFN